MSNENQYIEAAKIAAETAASNTQLTMIFTIGSAVLALMGVGLTTWITYKNASRSAVVDALTKQRIEWLNNLREKFVEFNTLTNEIYLSVKINGSGPIDLLEKYHSLEKVKTHIRLLLNPHESEAWSLNDTSRELMMLLFIKGDIDIDKFTKLLVSVDNFQQTILKSEWIRIKEEIKKGRELKSKEVSVIYAKTYSEVVKYSKIRRNF